MLVGAPRQGNVECTWSAIRSQATGARADLVVHRSVRNNAEEGCIAHSLINNVFFLQPPGTAAGGVHQSLAGAGGRIVVAQCRTECRAPRFGRREQCCCRSRKQCSRWRCSGDSHWNCGFGSATAASGRRQRPVGWSQPATQPKAKSTSSQSGCCAVRAGGPVDAGPGPH